MTESSNKNIPLFKVFMNPDASDSVSKILNSGYIGQGEQVNKFESGLQKFFNWDHVTTVNSATSGLHLSVRMAKDKIKQSGYDGPVEVLTSPLTCTATNWPILANNLPIKWVDVDADTMNIDLDDLERKLSPTTRIIMIVHWGGYSVDYDRLANISQTAKNLYGYYPIYIEDCAHSFGSTYKGFKLGTYFGLPNESRFAVYSFQAIKHLTSVDGGAILSNATDAKQANLLRWYGIDRESNRKDFRCEADVEAWGYKFHMNDINATVGIENLKVINPIIARHQANAEFYYKNLSNISGVSLLENRPEIKSAYWLYTIKVHRQDDFSRAMLDRGITVSRVHERNDKHTATKEFETALPSLEKVVKEMMCIPVGWWVTDEDRSYVVDAIKEGW